jgi:plasmid stability protein
MATSITIRDIPDQVYQKIKEQAELNHRSINSEVVYYLTQLVKSQRIEAIDIINRAELLKKQSKRTLTIEEILDSIDEGRP